MKDRKPVTREQLDAAMAQLGNKARSVLKERGMTDAQIDAEIAKGSKRPKPQGKVR